MAGLRNHPRKEHENGKNQQVRAQRKSRRIDRQNEGRFQKNLPRERIPIGRQYLRLKRNTIDRTLDDSDWQESGLLQLLACYEAFNVRKDVGACLLPRSLRSG